MLGPLGAGHSCARHRARPFSTKPPTARLLCPPAGPAGPGAWRCSALSAGPLQNRNFYSAPQCWKPGPTLSHVTENKASRPRNTPCFPSDKLVGKLSFPRCEEGNDVLRCLLWVLGFGAMKQAKLPYVPPLLPSHPAQALSAPNTIV